MLLEVKNLTVNYGTVIALDNVSLCVNENEIVTLVGPNGAGKSTALKAICGLIRPPDAEIKNGEILFEGKKINETQPDELVKKGLCLVPEGRRVFTTMTVMENLEMGGFTLKRSQKLELKSQVEKVFNLFPVLKERYKQKAGTLSGGEQQMLAIGRAMILKPKLLMLDEPSLGLSPNYVETVFEKLKEINKNGVTILIVEQNVRMALEYSDRGYIFKIGGILKEGKSKDLLDDPEIKKAFLGE